MEVKRKEIFKRLADDWKNVDNMPFWRNLREEDESRYEKEISEFTFKNGIDYEGLCQQLSGDNFEEKIKKMADIVEKAKNKDPIPFTPFPIHLDGVVPEANIVSNGDNTTEIESNFKIPFSKNNPMSKKV